MSSQFTSSGYTYLFLTGLISSLLTVPVSADDQIPNIMVIGTTDDKERVSLVPTESPITQPSTGELLKRSPGGSLNFNGPTSGIGQYRGMFGYRLKTKVNGVSVVSGGPNWMDAPLHYAPMPLVKSVRIQRGVAPVSVGPESIGGFVETTTYKSEFSAGSDFAFQGMLNASTQTVDSGFGIGTVLGGANDTHRVHFLGVIEKGDDTEFEGGDIIPTEYDRKAAGLGYGFTSGDQTFAFDYMRNETDNAGTPALPMDIVYIDADVASFAYNGVLGGINVDAKVHYNEVEHLMNNYSLRADPMMPTMFRANLADGEAVSFDLQAEFDLGAGELAVGVDGEFAEHNANISNPNAAMFFIENFNDVTRDRLGLFGEWTSPEDDDFEYEVGLRFTRVDADSGQVDGTPAIMMPPAGMLRDAFNSANRDLDWDLYDIVLKNTFLTTETVSFDVTLAHKERAPAYQELYLWLPLQATAGLADGKNYIGNLNLKKEKANIIELGMKFEADATYFGPRVFYQKVDNYIQGTPVAGGSPAEMFCTMMGPPMCSNPVLQFTNVDARLYGVDTDFGSQLSDNLRIDGVVSYVRGERRDIDDDLYRISPLSSIVGLSYIADDWKATVEGVFAAAQNDISVTNEESKSPGYGYMNLYGTYTLDEGLKVTGGVNNVFDKLYADHTNGINRARGSDVAVGDRVPGPGRSLFVRLSYNW